jgi:serine/threonine-protein kinase
MKPWQVVLWGIGSSVVTSAAMYLVLGGTMPAPTDVPTLVGLSIEQARKLSDNANLLLRFEGERVPEGAEVPPGTVIEQKPLGGSRVRSGEVIVATLASAVQRTRVPVLMEQPLEAAQRSLEEAGLKPGKITETQSQTIPPGQIVETRPPAGAEVRKGETVSLVVSKGAEVTVPNLRGMLPAAARAALEKAGLQLGERRTGVDDNAADSVILRQNPPPGSAAQRGSKVDIVVNQ